MEGMQELKAPSQIPRLGIFSDSKATKKMSKMMKGVEGSLKSLKTRLKGVLANPATNDPVYQACQRIFHKADDLVLTREDKVRLAIRKKAWNRSLHGCPPRKRTDTSIGDAINWEWMVYCANAHKADLVIVSRDSDYGVTFDNNSYINDHLKQEFSERVSRKRHLQLYTKVSDALKNFQIPVSAEVTKAETDLVEAVTLTPEKKPQEVTTLGDLVASIDWVQLAKNYHEWQERLVKPAEAKAAQATQSANPTSPIAPQKKD